VDRAGGQRDGRDIRAAGRRGERLSRADDDSPPGTGQASEPRHATVRYPGGLTARYRWVGSGQSAALFALTIAGGDLVDHGPLGAPDPDAVCRAEVRVEGPGGTWTARFASPIFDEPRAVLWDVPGLLVVTYGFRTYALDPRTGDLRWSHRSGSPIVTILASSLLDHVIVQAEVETFALAASGEVVWRLAHGEVVVQAALVGGQLVLAAYNGEQISLDPVTGRSSG
jgi:outer membrane protein assembly factor BamB